MYNGSIQRRHANGQLKAAGEKPVMIPKTALGVSLKVTTSSVRIAVMCKFDENISVEEDAAYYEWVWRHEMEVRAELDQLDELERVNVELQEAAYEECPF